MTGARRHQSAAGTISPRAPAPRLEGDRRSRLARVLAGCALLVLTATLYWLLTDEDFRVAEEQVKIVGMGLATEAQVRAHLGDIERSPNVFRVRASDLVEGLRTLPTVSSATATVTLPGGVHIEVTEREPLFVWLNGGEAWFVDESGLLFARATVEASGEGPSPSAAPGASATTGAASPRPEASAGPGTVQPSTEAGGGPAGASPPRGSLVTQAAGLPLVEDGRLPDEAAVAGTSRLSEIDLAVMRQLLAVTPEMVGSDSSGLRLRIDEIDGYVLMSEDLGWRAIFGHYTPTLQPPTHVPRQVQCLHWTLARWEDRLDQARLVIAGNGCGSVSLQGQG